jgi:hypothetical protein
VRYDRRLHTGSDLKIYLTWCAGARSLAGMTSRDWHAWHDAYDDPDSWQAKRLITVRERIRVALDARTPGDPSWTSHFGSGAHHRRTGRPAPTPVGATTDATTTFAQVSHNMMAIH